MKINLDPEGQLPVMDRIKTLPYWGSYAKWTAHVDDCEPCVLVLQSTGVVEELCLQGQAMHLALLNDLENQAGTATLN